MNKTQTIFTYYTTLNNLNNNNLNNNTLNTNISNNNNILNTTNNNQNKSPQSMQDVIQLELDSVQERIMLMVQKDILKKHQDNYKIWQGENGYWYTYLPNETKKNKRKLIKKKQEKDLLNAIVEFYQASPTLETLYYEWVQHKIELRTIKKATVDRYNIDWERFYLPHYISQKEVSKITKFDIKNFLEQILISFHPTAKDFANCKTILRGLFKYARNNEYTTIRPEQIIEDLEISKKSFKSVKKRTIEEVFSLEEFKLLNNYFYYNIGNFKSSKYLGVYLALLTGIRVGELSSLKWDNIIKEDNQYYLSIEATETKYHDENGKMVYEVADTPKTENSIREIPLADITLQILSEVKKFNQENKIESEFIFVSRNNKRYKGFDFDTAIRNVCNKLSIAPRSMHKLRKTFASILKSNNVSDLEIQQLLGHSSYQTTAKYYLFNVKSKKETASKLNEIFSN